MSESVQISPITGQPTRKYEMREDRRTCTAHSKNGNPCKKIAILGGFTCVAHGGRAPQVKEAARIRMEMAADKMVKVLLKIAGVDLDDENVAPAVKLKAALAVLDRAGLAPKNALDVTVGPREPWQELLAGVGQLEGGSRAESRAARGVPDDPPRPHDVVDAEVVEERAECAGCGLVWGGRPLPDWLDTYPEFCKTCRAERGLPRPGRDGRSYPARADAAELRQPPPVTGRPTHPAPGASDARPGLVSFEDAVAGLAEATRKHRQR